MRPGAAHGRLKGPDVPDGIERLWHYFSDLASCRSYGGMGTPLPISHLEIFAWTQLHGIRLEPWELRALRLLDAAQLEAFSTVPGEEEP